MAAVDNSISFEKQSATAAVEFSKSGLNNNGAGGGGIVTSGMRDGAACMKINVSASFSWYGHQIKSATSSTVKNCRMYIKFTTLPGVTTELISAYDSVGVSQQACICITSGGALQLRQTTPTGTQIGSNGPTLATGSWYYIEMSVSGGTGNATLKGWSALDDGSAPVLFASSTTATVSDFDAFYFGNPGTSATYNMLHDSITMGDNFQGIGKVTTIVAASAGDVNTFATQTGGTAGSSNNFTRVNEAIPDDATTFNGSSTLNEEDMFKFGSTGLAAGDVIDAVQVNLRIRNSTADVTGAIKAQIRKSRAKIARIQSKLATGTKNVSATFAAPTTPGNLLMAVVAGDDNHGALTTTFTAPAGWTQAATQGSTSGVVYIFYYYNNPGGITATGNFVNSNTTARADTTVIVVEYSGFGSADPLDKTAANTGSSVTADTGTTAADVQANELWIGGLGLDNGATTFAALTNGFTSVETDTFGCFLEKISSVVGTANSSSTITSNIWNGVVATFKQTAETTTQSASTVVNSVTWKTDNSTVQMAPLINQTTDPDGNAWTVPELNAVQAGYKLTTAPGTAGRRTDVTNVWINIISHTPLPGKKLIISQAVNRAATF